MNQNRWKKKDLFWNCFVVEKSNIKLSTKLKWSRDKNEINRVDQKRYTIVSRLKQHFCQKNRPT